MRIFTDVNQLQSYLKEQRVNKKIGFVPTMGALHKGHVSLLEYAAQGNDLIVCSIYINPTQFNNQNDLAHYPRTFEADKNLLLNAACDVLFVPSDQVMYPVPAGLQFNFGYLEEIMEGKFRKGHFNGVAIVVSKLFHIVQPDTAYFGQKDLQQFVIIKQLVNSLSFNVELVCCPIVRENDGLAMSSRNMRLDRTQRALAPQLYQTLLMARDLVLKLPVEEVHQAVHTHLSTIKDLQLEYFAIIDSESLLPVKELIQHQQVSLCIAAYLGEIRLIDNLFLFD
jgi:pantoate--beta-alanine ligase